MSNAIVLERPLQSALRGAEKLERRRVYIFPTRRGASFSVMLLVMLLGAINYTNSMAYALTFLLASLYVVCMLHAYRNLRGLVVRANRPADTFAGDRAGFPYLFDNRDGPHRTAVRATPWPAKRPSRRNRVAAEDTLINLEPGSVHAATLAVPAVRRGPMRLDRVRIACTFPLGLFRAWSYLEQSPACLVYPKPAGVFPLPQPATADEEELTGTRYGTDDFVGFRAYRIGDSIRSIDWKALAREQGLLVKRFSGAGARRLTLSWDQVPLDDTERRLSQLCRWVLDADREGLLYGLELPGVNIAPDHGEQHRAACLRALACHGFDDPGP